MLQLQDLEQGTEEHAVLSTIVMVATTIRKDNAIPTNFGIQAFCFLTEAAIP